MPSGYKPAHGFPQPGQLASLTETDLRNCKMGFRAPYLLKTACAISEKRLVLSSLAKMPVAEAREQLVALPGVGPKIADCVLLFAYGFPSAFPVDVWVMVRCAGCISRGANPAARACNASRRPTSASMRVTRSNICFITCARIAPAPRRPPWPEGLPTGGLEFIPENRNPAGPMPTTLEVLFTPAEYEALSERDLSQTVCVVFDVFRATSTIVTALANGAAAIIPVAEIPDALALRRQNPEILLAGEREGLRIHKGLTGGIDFDLGNSPREFIPDRVRGKSIALSTTNGSRALRACAQAKEVLVGSFLNLAATVAHIRRHRAANLLLVVQRHRQSSRLQRICFAPGAGRKVS